MPESIDMKIEFHRIAEKTIPYILHSTEQHRKEIIHALQSLQVSIERSNTIDFLAWKHKTESLLNPPDNTSKSTSEQIQIYHRITLSLNDRTTALEEKINEMDRQLKYRLNNIDRTIGVEKRLPYKCDMCSERFNTQKTLDNHLIKAHPTQQPATSPVDGPTDMHIEAQNLEYILKNAKCSFCRSKLKKRGFGTRSGQRRFQCSNPACRRGKPPYFSVDKDGILQRCSVCSGVIYKPGRGLNPHCQNCNPD